MTVIMATCNGAKVLPKVLEAYCALQAPAKGWKLVIVDDGSTDDSRAIVAGYADRLPLLPLHQDRSGKNTALNRALEHVLADPAVDLVVLTDDDTSPAPDWLTTLADCAAQQPDFAIFGGRIVPDWGAAPPDWILRLVPLGITYAVTDSTDGPVDPRMVWGANMAVRRAVFDAGHRFNTAVGPSAGAYAMGSETEFTRRMAAAGYRTWFCNGATVGHYIRPHQLSMEFALQRAYRFGRGTRVQEIRSEIPCLGPLPRWMVAKYVREALAAARAWLLRDRDTLFRKRWELQFLHGYFYEARREAARQA